MLEIKKRLEQIQYNKNLLGNEYQDYGLLVCHHDGTPYDPKQLNRIFKKAQKAQGISREEQIEFQGLRKSGQMYKIRLSGNNYQLVAESAGQSPEVLMHHYNESQESEKKSLVQSIDYNLYPSNPIQPLISNSTANIIIQAVKNNKELSKQILQMLLIQDIQE